MEIGNAGVETADSGMAEYKMAEYKMADMMEIGLKLEREKKVAVESGGPEDTFALGRGLGLAARPGTVYALNGDLGTGKTVFTQGFAEGLGISGPVNSPTFTVMQIYDEGRIPFYHFDVYRITDIDEMEEIGYEDCFYGEGVCLVEWAGLIEEILPGRYVRVTIEKDLEKGFDYRRILLEEVRGTCAGGGGKEAK